MVTIKNKSFHKGKWIFDLLQSVFDKTISLNNGSTFFLARFRKKPLILVMNEIIIPNVDHTKWSLIWEIFLGKQYNPIGFKINETDLVVDIGAHKGIFVAYAAQYTKNQIIAFEPDAANYQELIDLVEQNGWSNITVNNLAISSKDEKIKFFTSDTSTRHSMLGVDLVTGKEINEWLLVDAVSLTTALKNVSAIDYLKMDCEGAEVQIIQNTPAETMQKIKRIAMEYHDEINSERFNILLSTLKKYYQTIIIQPTGHDNLGYIFACDLSE